MSVLFLLARSGISTAFTGRLRCTRKKRFAYINGQGVRPQNLTTTHMEKVPPLVLFPGWALFMTLLGGL